MERHDIEFTEIGETWVQQLIKARFYEANVRQLGGFGERSRGDDMSWIEVNADK
jgi:hypothetical protein